MTELSDIFERLGLAQYLDRFIEEGFDSWETVLYATESDLQVLEVKLGHRRKLQKEIAHARGITIEQVIGAIGVKSSLDDGSHGDGDLRSFATQGDSRNPSSGPSKRKYRRHPKPDDNAPERAPSAYVIFSNKTREELKPQKLSFTDIAKIVGERWQMLAPDDKEQYESQAAMAKDQYNAALAKYKRTSLHREYQKYLTDFKARNTPQSTSGTFKRPPTKPLAQRRAGTKRPKLETEISGASSGSTTSVNTMFNEVAAAATTVPRRAESISSQPVHSPHMASPSPTVLSQIKTRPQESTDQSSSSLPNTPTNTEFSTITHIAPSIPAQRPFDVHPPQLPRIFTLEGRDSRPHIASLIADSSTSINPRRSATASPAAFLRQDTSKSSASSVLSRESGAHSVYSPITPTEDGLPSRSLPRIPGLSTHGSADSAYSGDIDRWGAQLGPPPPPPLSRYGKDMVTAIPKANSGYTQSFHHLTIQPEVQEAQRLSNHPTQRDPVVEHIRSLSATDPVSRQSQFSVPVQPDTNKLDPLSVLALAGRLVDQESPESGGTMKPGGERITRHGPERSTEKETK